MNGQAIAKLVLFLQMQYYVPTETVEGDECGNRQAFQAPKTEGYN